MGKGFLRIQTVTANEGVIVGNVSITVSDENDRVLYEVQTDAMGKSVDMALDAPDKRYTEEPNPPVRPFAYYKVMARVPGFMTVIYNNVMILDTSTSILNIDMDPVVRGREQAIEYRDIGGHKLYETTEPQQVQVGTPEVTPVPRILPEVTIPNFIRVHLGREENTSAPTVSVPYLQYIKNVTSHEIFDTWPEEALIANIYCIISLTLNRVYTEFYRKRGRDYDITSETYMDQKFVNGGTIGARISAIVDRIYNNYLAIIGHKEPFIALYNDGVRVNIPGRLSQWGSFYDARDRGMNAWQIIQKYYSQNLELRVTNNFGGVLVSYPGYTLTLGTRGEAVRTMQLYLNRIFGRYTNNVINPVDGIFGTQTRNLVLAFQQQYNLQQTGNIDQRTWYEISRIYSIERALWEMYSEGQRIGVGTTPPTSVVRLNDQGALVVELQFLLDFIGMYHSEIPFVAQTSRFDTLTQAGVIAFQRKFGLTADGTVGATTWQMLYDVYWGIINSTIPPKPPEQPEGPSQIPPFPGVSLRVGSTGAAVRQVQEAINKLAEVTPGMWTITVDGIFGNGTRDAVMAFQRIFGLVIDGIVGPITWERLMRESYTSSETPGIPAFPGDLSVGSSGTNVRLVQEAINQIAPCHPGRLWILSADGIFGNMTRDAIFSFQSVFGLPITGVVNETTWNRLMQEAAKVASEGCGNGGGGGGVIPGIPPFPGNLGVGSSGDNVRLVQEALNKLAPYHPGRLWILTVDGSFGNMTRDAIFAFQSIFGLPITGVVNEATWNRLMQEAANGQMEPETTAMPMKAMPVENIMPMSDMMPMGNLGPAMMHGAEAAPGNMSGVISGFNAMPVKDDMRPIGYVGLNDGMKLGEGVVLRDDPRPMEYHERHMDDMRRMGHHEMEHDRMRRMGHEMEHDRMRRMGHEMEHDGMRRMGHEMEHDGMRPMGHEMKHDGMRPMGHEMKHDGMRSMDHEMKHDGMRPMSHEMKHDGMRPMGHEMKHGHERPMEHEMKHGHMRPMEHEMKHGHERPMDHEMKHGHERPMEREMKHGHERAMGHEMKHGHERPMGHEMKHDGMRPMGHEMKHGDMRPMGHDAKKDKEKRVDYDAPKTDMEPAVEVMSGSVLTHPYGYVPYGADYRRMDPREMRYYDRGPDRRGYGYGYRERNYCDVRGRYDGRCSCGCARGDCRCRRW